MYFLVVWCGGAVFSVLRKSANFIGIRPWLLAMAVVCCLACPRQSNANPPIYDPIYTAPGWNCNGTEPACCNVALIPALLHEMFAGVGLYTGRDDLQQHYYIRTLWAMMRIVFLRMTDEFRNVVLFSTSSIGAMMDAQNLNQTLLSLQKQTTDTLHSESVSEQICRFGTLSRSLALSDERSRVVQEGLATRMQHRQLLKTNMSSGTAATANRELGRAADKIDRWAQFRTTFCDPSDSNAALSDLCSADSDEQQNRDIDVARSLTKPLTLNIDFIDNAAPATEDEQNIFALSSNLYANDLATNLGKSDFNQIKNENSEKADGRIEELFDWRSAIAKRGVAQNSFAAIAGMKAAGSGSSATYMREIIRELGLVLEEDLIAALGENPSYYAQMEVLARKIYQSPKFYANLMDSPANIGRQQTAMEGIELMQDRDIYESLRRSEMLMSSILEIYVLREQDGFKDKGAK